ncbi:MAG TPA: stalk domain-containing protein [Candidatus Baltobacteraceae bacterium]|nr:stalk domain-containing protein [Candidatus Baltobacteraceae bacterium]
MQRLAVALVAAALPASPATAHTGTPLARVAGSAGYAYAWSASASEVTLSRPGLTIVLRPGDRRYEINDRVEYASEAPTYGSGDLLVSSDVVAELRMLAGRTPVVRAMEGARPGTVVSDNASGSLTLTARPAVGRAGIVVDGTAPASVPVTLTLVATISRDLPDILIRRITLATDGTFHTTLDVAPAVPEGSTLTITATSLPGIAPATAHVTAVPPNPHLDTQFDHLPKD